MMYGKFLFGLFFFIVWSDLVKSQQFESIEENDKKTKIQGNIINANGEPINDVQIKIVNDTNTLFSDEKGIFIFMLSQKNSHYIVLQFVKDLYTTKMLIVYFKEGQIIYNLSPITLEQSQTSEIIDIPTVSMSENDLEAEGANQSVPSLLTSTKNLFLQQTQFNLAMFRFSPRGNSNRERIVMINGNTINNLNTGATPYNAFGGLNDVLRNNNTSYGLFQNSHAINGIGSIQTISTFASNIFPQLNITYVNSNVNYTNTWRLSYASGLLKKGWSLAIAFTKRYALPPMAGKFSFNSLPGTWSDAYGYFLSVDKQAKNHLVNLTIMGSPNQRATSSPTVKEAQNLLKNSLYNPNWGYFDGAIRSAAITNIHTPIISLTDVWQINQQNQVSISFMGMFGKDGKTALDWYNTEDPRADYYRNLPSYYIENPALMKQIADEIKANPNLLQINWNKLYLANTTNTDVFPGASSTEKRSQYLIGENRRDPIVLNLSAIGEHILSDKYLLNSGLNYIYSYTHYFKQVNDLLGGDYFVNLNQFGASAFPANADAAQVNLNNPNQLVRKGDIYNYNYAIFNHQANAWAQINAKYHHIDFYASTNLSMQSFYRYGYYKSGLFPTDSYGKGQQHNYFNLVLKGGVTYKINGKNYLLLNVFGGTQAPLANDVYLSSRTRDHVIPNVKSIIVLSGEIGYFYRSEIVKLQVTAFFSQKNNLTSTRSYFDDNYGTFVNLSLYDLQQRTLGVEAAAQIKITKTLQATMAATYGKYYYANRPKEIISIDNTNSVQSEQTVYIKNFNIPNTIAQGYSLSLQYNSPQYWFVSITGNVAGPLYYDFAPNTRTLSVTGGMDPNSILYKNAVTQQATPYQFTLNAMAGYNLLMNKIFKMKSNRKFYLNLMASVNNIINNRTIVVFAYEQLRYDFSKGDNNSFAPKVMYAYGINYQLTMAFKMQ